MIVGGDSRYHRIIFSCLSLQVGENIQSNKRSIVYTKMEQEQVCFVCDKDLSSDIIRCKGVCNISAHAKCLELTKTVSKALQEITNLSYVCDDCKDNSYEAINVKLNKILSVIHIYDERVTRNEKQIVRIVEQIDDLKSVVSEKTEKIVDEMKNRAIPAPGKNEIAQSYAEKVKMINNESLLMLKPKCNQNSAVTEGEVKKHIDPTKVNIKSLKKMPKGGILIECVDLSEKREVEKIMTEKMSDNYEVVVPNLTNPRVKIVGINEEMEESELIKALKSQNDFLKGSDIKIVHFFGTRRKDFTAIVELDAQAFERCMSNKKVKVMWSRCNVMEDINVFRCFKCNGFNHKGDKCKNKQSCKKCAGNHDFHQCKSKKVECVNCKYANEKYNLKLNINHSVTSDDCAVYLRRVETERRKVKYST